ncbi:HNH endonuclease signature motif containing protein [Candidatus Contubernalis alkaliaceticus]|uniref:HNH endonuclease signature motif containing protein n=1 Tax=Candidatus Contubernalis alkaliaceticus TaxID=338645 RepID=UPI001F4C3998|nr:HNH endonuclease signature motif containing protein [Candidatus Contubernalis alkalaceticus]UNC91686.1 HNH endonuclease [Candidatus Contubernalis alkalaceticus]
MKKVNPFYKTTAWLKFRAFILVRDNYLCQHCLRKKRLRTANIVHHKKPIELFPERALEPDNCESVCPSCHNKEHPERGGGNRKKKKSEKRLGKVRVIKAEANPNIIPPLP